jgi:hypothetical protein
MQQYNNWDMQPVLSNGSVKTPLQKYLLLETLFSILSVQSGYKEES